MTIYVKNKKQKNIGCIRESFYDIATGPSNHDMKITWLKNRYKQVSRLYYSIKLYQQLKLDFLIKKISISLSNTVEGQDFAFRLRFITPNPKQDLETETYFLNQTVEVEEENIDL